MNPTLWIVASAIGGGVVVALAVWYRKLAARREVELADELIDAEYRELQRPDEREIT